MSNIKLRTAAGGSVTLTPENVAGDVTLTVPGDNSTLVSAADLSASTGASGVGYLPAGTGAVATTVEQQLRNIQSWQVNVKDAPFYAKGDGITDDTAAIQAAITAVSAAGGGTVYFPQGNYYITAPIEVAAFVNLVGASQGTTITKTNSATSSGGVNCVVYGNGKSRFFIENLQIVGNRVRNTSTGVVTVSTYGFYLDGCSYFDVRNTRARACINGYVYKTCWACSLEQATAQQCQQYGFVLQSANTSTVLRNTTAWGCGGGWSLSGCVYTQLIGCACDHSDAGKHPSDPFLPSGSGGDYQNAAFIFNIVASQGITIISPGTENSYSQYIYCEGAQVTVLSPYIYNLQCYDTTWVFISTRGTGKSNVSILNPWFTSVTNTLGVSSNIKGYYVENSAVQRINIVGKYSLDGTFGAYEYAADGLYSENETAIAKYTQQEMVIGSRSQFIHGATDLSNVILTGATKELQIDSVSANVVDFDQPLPSSGIFKIKATGTYNSSYDSAKIRIVETNGTTTNVLKSWTNSGNALSINEAFYLAAQSGYSLVFRVTTNHTTDVLKFTNLEIAHVPNQQP